MSSALPEGFVDPLDEAQVSGVMRAAAGRLGTDGLVNLLAQVPGVLDHPRTPGRRAAASAAGAAALG